MANKPVEIVQACCAAGAYKGNLSQSNWMLRAFMAGLYIAVGGALATVCSTGLKDIAPGLGQLIAGAVFPVGLIAIVLTGMELFTGDCMLMPVACMNRKLSWSRMLWAWVFVYIGNFLGSIFWAYLMSVGPFVVGGPGGELTAFGKNAVAIAQAKVLPYMAAGAGGFWSAFMKGIACNLLVNVAILLALSSKNMIGKFFGIWFPIMAFVASGFEHSVANMYFIPTGIFLGASVTWDQFLVWNLAPVTLGNIVGGMVFIGWVYQYCFKGEFPKES
ncbi:MAG: formate/nitrite transporter family protein [Myxococcales bacterium]|nr:formate/nitrite transporter family protein [Myxococcales bacterium]